MQKCIVMKLTLILLKHKTYEDLMILANKFKYIIFNINKNINNFPDLPLCAHTY